MNGHDLKESTKVETPSVKFPDKIQVSSVPGAQEPKLISESLTSEFSQKQLAKPIVADNITISTVETTTIHVFPNSDVDPPKKVPEESSRKLLKNIGNSVLNQSENVTTDGLKILDVNKALRSDSLAPSEGNFGVANSTNVENIFPGESYSTSDRTTFERGGLINTRLERPKILVVNKTISLEPNVLQKSFTPNSSDIVQNATNLENLLPEDNFKLGREFLIEDIMEVNKTVSLETNVSAYSLTPSNSEVVEYNITRIENLFQSESNSSLGKRKHEIEEPPYINLTRTEFMKVNKTVSLEGSASKNNLTPLDDHVWEVNNTKLDFILPDEGNSTLENTKAKTEGRSNADLTTSDVKFDNFTYEDLASIVPEETDSTLINNQGANNFDIVGPDIEREYNISQKAPDNNKSRMKRSIQLLYMGKRTLD